MVDIYHPVPSIPLPFYTTRTVRSAGGGGRRRQPGPNNHTHYRRILVKEPSTFEVGTPISPSPQRPRTAGSFGKPPRLTITTPTLDRTSPGYLVRPKSSRGITTKTEGKQEGNKGLSVRDTIKARCSSAPVHPPYSRPTSAYHMSCTQPYPCPSSFRLPVYIVDEEDARTRIRDQIKRNKEVLVAVLDCYSLVPHLFQKDLLSQRDVERVMEYDTRQAQNRTLLNTIVSRDSYNAHKIIEEIRNHKDMFKDVLRVEGLKNFIYRYEKENFGKKLCSALRTLREDEMHCSSYQPCPICVEKKPKKRRVVSASVAQISREFSDIDLKRDKGREYLQLPQQAPVTASQRKHLIRTLRLLNKISPEIRDQDNKEWLRVISAEPDIIPDMYSKT